jgi:ribosomal protein S18 acetylase RimI-like enzyme
VRAIFIEYAADNPAAEAFYSQAGFTVTGRRKGYYRSALAACPCDAVTARLDL